MSADIAPESRVDGSGSSARAEYLPARDLGSDAVLVDIGVSLLEDVSGLANSVRFSLERWSSEGKMVVFLKLPHALFPGDPVMKASTDVAQRLGMRLFVVVPDPPPLPVLDPSFGWPHLQEQKYDSAVEVKGTSPTPARQKRRRGPNYEHDEKTDLLVEKLEWFVGWRETIHKPGEIQNWTMFVSKFLSAKHGIHRPADSCRQLWDTLMRHFKAIHEYESKIQSGTSTDISFWKMDETQRSSLRLPTVFKMAWYVLMEKIIEVRARKQAPREGTRRSGQAGTIRQSLFSVMEASTNTDSTNFAAGPEIQVSTEPTLTLSDSLANIQGSQQPEGEQLDLHDRSAVTFREDDPLARVALFVNKQISDALKPVLAALDIRNKDQLKYREKVLASREEQLATLRQEVQLGGSVFPNSMGNADSYGAQAPSVNPILDDELFASDTYFKHEDFLKISEWTESSGDV